MFPNSTIEYILDQFKEQIGKDYERYKNHVYRVFSNCLMMDTDPVNEEKYAIAAAFHDLGIWTNQTFDYLGPSENQARLYLTEKGKQEWIEEIAAMIHFHHKISRYHGRFEKTVATFRKADWIDVSLGLITFGNDRRAIDKTRNDHPNLGFHSFLLKETSKNFLKNPFKPLPMFKA
jgi:hypothetical protein